MADIATTNNIKTLISVDTEYSADSVEWCPINGYEHLLLCGLYQLADEEGKLSSERSDQRLGRLLVFTFDNNHLKQRVCREMAAVLDIKWSHHLVNDKLLFAVTTASGKLIVFETKCREDGCIVEELCSEVLCSEGLLLSLDWSTTLTHSACPQLLVSDSKGDVHLIELSHNKLSLLQSWTAHGYEAWICAFNSWNSSILYTGGDDCRLKIWDRRVSFDTPLITSKRHEMGVTSMQCAYLREHLLATGSYDSHVLIWDDRNMKCVLSDTDARGGVWRIKWQPHNNSHVLTASMYSGFHVLDCQHLQEDGQAIVASYMEHESLAYGADWRTHHSEPSHSLIATCSFYDHKLNLWTIN